MSEKEIEELLSKIKKINTNDFVESVYRLNEDVCMKAELNVAYSVFDGQYYNDEPIYKTISTMKIRDALLSFNTSDDVVLLTLNFERSAYYNRMRNLFDRVGDIRDDENKRIELIAKDLVSGQYILMVSSNVWYLDEQSKSVSFFCEKNNIDARFVPDEVLKKIEEEKERGRQEMIAEIEQMIN